MNYPAIVTQEGPHILIVFPDLPDCQVIASPNDNLLRVAQDTLVRYLGTTLRNHGSPPRPSEKITVQKEARCLVVPLPEELISDLQARWG